MLNESNYRYSVTVVSGKAERLSLILVLISLGQNVGGGQIQPKAKTWNVSLKATKDKLSYFLVIGSRSGFVLLVVVVMFFT